MPQAMKYGATSIFLEIVVLFENLYNFLIIVHPTSPWS